ncbi:Kinesin heavy chain [Emydomyces testavorans]|uniref:Kinesin heavy chain n=1 Tax=Emydomyces testavorans TaxID=2070801 RepID=A0AAF0DNW1_9EURO|nr:Kinesin heavy chain [Emydomyces testavorans]
MASGSTGSYNTIKVVARFRPQNKIETANGGQPIVEFESEETCRINFYHNQNFDIAVDIA